MNGVGGGIRARSAAPGAARAREAAFAVRVGSPENQEALRAFLEKRPASFRGVAPTDRS